MKESFPCAFSADVTTLGKLLRFVVTYKFTTLLSI